jgi:hypothetical protein
VSAFVSKQDRKALLQDLVPYLLAAFCEISPVFSKEPFFQLSQTELHLNGNIRDFKLKVHDVILMSGAISCHICIVTIIYDKV